jgi:hypothetical protein
MEEQGNVGTQTGAYARQFRHAETAIPEPIQRRQRRRCVAAATAQPAPDWNPFVQLDPGSAGGIRGSVRKRLPRPPGQVCVIRRDVRIVTGEVNRLARAVLKAHLVGQIDADHQRADLVEPVISTAQYVKNQVDFSRRAG